MVACTGKGMGERGKGKKSGENVVPVVERGREGGVLEARREKGRGSKRGRRKKTGELESVSVRPRAGHSVVFSNSFVALLSVQEMSRSQVARSCEGRAPRTRECYW